MWEEIEDEYGRIYYWNVETNQVSWERPLKTKEKVLIKAETRIEDDCVKLRLVQCQPKDKIINRIWDQLSEKQKEMNELESIFRTNIISKVFKTSVFLLLTNYFNYWKNVSNTMIIDEISKKTTTITRWKEYMRYKDTFCNTLKIITKENEMLLNELVNVKAKLAHENYARLSKC